MSGSIYREGYAGTAVPAPGAVVASPIPTLATAPPVPHTGLLPNQPAVVGTTGTLTNPYMVKVAVYITGGAVSVIAQNGTTIFTATEHTVVLAVGDTISLTYSSAPTWKWFGLP